MEIGFGALWVYSPTGGVGVQVNHGGFSVLVPTGSLMVDAGDGSGGLLLVISGEVLLVDALGTSQVLTANEAAVLGAGGDLASVDRVGDDELAADRWAVANRAWDANALRELLPDDDGHAPSGLYVSPEVDEVPGRSITRFVEIAALLLLMGTIVAIALISTRDDDGNSGTPLANPTATSTTSTTAATTTRSPASSITALPPTVKVEVNFCTQSGEGLVAQGTIEGAPPGSTGYRLTLEVQLGARVFGSKTITIERSPDGGPAQWAAEIPVEGDPVGAGAECKIRAVDGVRVI